MEADCQIINNDLNLKCWEAKASEFLKIALPPTRLISYCIKWRKWKTDGTKISWLPLLPIFIAS
jgi:hypothetical protein